MEQESTRHNNGLSDYLLLERKAPTTFLTSVRLHITVYIDVSDYASFDHAWNIKHAVSNTGLPVMLTACSDLDGVHVT